MRHFLYVSDKYTVELIPAGHQYDPLIPLFDVTRITRLSDSAVLNIPGCFDVHCWIDYFFEKEFSEKMPA